MEGKDKSLIWEDCAACAYKHLTAAYAALTSVAGPQYIPAYEVYLARAQIALREVEAGYEGNRDLAAGCLAMAEVVECSGHQGLPKFGDTIRQLRLEISSGSETRFFVPYVESGAYAGAHFIEAIRELPELADRMPVREWMSDGGFVCENPLEFREALVKQLKWVKDTYEIGKEKHGDQASEA